MKGKRDLAIPLNESALAVLERCQQIYPGYVFTFRGQRLKGIENHTWKKACNKAGIQDFRWHDLRHTWASWHVQSGTDLYTLMELGGWSSYTMVRAMHIWPATTYKVPQTVSRFKYRRRQNHSSYDSATLENRTISKDCENQLVTT